MVLDRDSKINVRGQGYRYPFYAALVHGYEDVVEAPLRQGGCVQDERPSWAIVAVVGSHEQTWCMAKILLGTRAVHVNTEDSNCRTARWWAVSHGFDGIAKTLVASGRVSHDLTDFDCRSLCFEEF